MDGIVGPQTWARLAPPTIKQGDTGNHVYLVQEILKSYSYPPFDPGPVDGIFGPLTKAAVENYQDGAVDYFGNELKVDGVVGPVTWRAHLQLSHTFRRSPAAVGLGNGGTARVPRSRLRGNCTRWASARSAWECGRRMSLLQIDQEVPRSAGRRSEWAACASESSWPRSTPSGRTRRSRSSATSS